VELKWLFSSYERQTRCVNENISSGQRALISSTPDDEYRPIFENTFLFFGTSDKAHKPSNRQTNILEQAFECIRHMRLPIAVTLTVYVCVYSHTQLTPSLMVIS